MAPTVYAPKNLTHSWGIATMKNALLLVSLTLVLTACGTADDSRCSLVKKDVEMAQKETSKERDDAIKALGEAAAAHAESVRFIDEASCLDEALISDELWESTQKQPLTIKALREVISKQRKECARGASASESRSAAQSSSKPAVTDSTGH
jgi:hypothetical protein